ncbi:hypothetical protein LEN26_009099 [Aphanomyces euteiches]|nr:hypothetical protein AeMF1_014403 [Aphanomyces euteiches]KAH9128494.1 hypothetical protein LEN26_009099 [Aphanomyces euteiches]KAH9188537.1 hypothetical protein AeNC1_009489 [Aphanomyces euteiches]
MSKRFATKSIVASTTIDRKEIAAAEEAATVFVNLHLVAPPCTENERKAIDLVIVLDKSGSMDGSKLDLCKQTINFLGQHLSDSDRVAVVTYDSKVHTPLHLTPMTPQGKAQLANVARTIEAGTSTNLSGGLSAGLKEVQRRCKTWFFTTVAPNPVQSVLLLTDGLANEGITDKVGLSKLLEQSLPSHVSLHTFGYGTDHDASLLTHMANLGRGSYYFIQNIDTVPLAFADCLGGLLSVVAQNIEVECVGATGVSIVAVKTKRPVTQTANTATIKMGDMFAEEVRDVLVHVELPVLVDPQTNVPVLDFRIRYANVLASSMDSIASQASIDRPLKVTNDSVDESVIAQKQRVEAAEAIDKARDLAEMGDVGQGWEKINAAIEQINEATSKMSSSMQAQNKYIVEELKACSDNMASQSVYKAHGHAKISQVSQAQWMQRSNSVGIEDALMAIDETDASTGKYRNAAKRSMMSKAGVSFGLFSSTVSRS